MNANSQGNECSLSCIDTNIQYWQSNTVDEQDQEPKSVDSRKNDRTVENENRIVSYSDIKYTTSSQSRNYLEQYPYGETDYLNTPYFSCVNNDYMRSGYCKNKMQGARGYGNYPYTVDRYGIYNSSGITKLWSKTARSYWDEEKTYTLNVETGNLTVSRRLGKMDNFIIFSSTHYNNMINGTKLLNVTKMTRGKRDGILKNEKERVVVKTGAMYLKGVWISFERAEILAKKHHIYGILEPLFDLNLLPDIPDRTSIGNYSALTRSRTLAHASSDSKLGLLNAYNSTPGYIYENKSKFEDYVDSYNSYKYNLSDLNSNIVNQAPSKKANLPSIKPVSGIFSSNKLIYGAGHYYVNEGENMSIINAKNTTNNLYGNYSENLFNESLHENKNGELSNSYGDYYNSGYSYNGYYSYENGRCEAVSTSQGGTVEKSQYYYQNPELPSENFRSQLLDTEILDLKKYSNMGIYDTPSQVFIENNSGEFRINENVDLDINTCIDQRNKRSKDDFHVPERDRAGHSIADLSGVSGIIENNPCNYYGSENKSYHHSLKINYLTAIDSSGTPEYSMSDNNKTNHMLKEEYRESNRDYRKL
ncbi:putative transcription factor PHD1 [Smittium mucronatum]|uniref:Putative transcription factor PHD1 n=1 Tax=Smittium mucronatum TaxID=133383 RepID=A0A1R0H025_9FUNG|nr:putative transcription factor PHD1 [Smittium mucronatum]